MHAIGALPEALLQKFLGIIAYRDDYVRSIDKLIRPNLEVSRRENVIRVRGEAESDWEKFVDPESRARCHSHEVGVNMAYPHFPEAQSNVNSLIEPKKIRAATPFIQRSDDFLSELPLFGRPPNAVQQFAFLGKIMHALYDARVPVLRRLVFRIPDGKNWRRDTLSCQLSDFPIAKRLSERRKSFEKISELRHQRNDE
jgi:hypothetical protein